MCKEKMLQKVDSVTLKGNIKRTHAKTQTAQYETLKTTRRNIYLAQTVLCCCFVMLCGHIESLSITYLITFTLSCQYMGPLCGYVENQASFKHTRVALTIINHIP